MRQLFVFETVDIDGRIAEVACLSDDEGEAYAMLVAEGYEGVLLGAVQLGADSQVVPITTARQSEAGAGGESITTTTAESTPEAAGSSDPAAPFQIEIDDVAAAALAAWPGGQLAATAALDAVARDYAQVSLYVAGLDVASIARAVGVAPRDVARRLAIHLLGITDSAPAAEDESPMALVDDQALAGIDEMYVNGMSVSEISDAVSRPVSDVAWALLDAPSHVVDVTRAVLRAIRSDLDVLKDAVRSFD